MVDKVILIGCWKSMLRRDINIEVLKKVGPLVLCKTGCDDENATVFYLTIDELHKHFEPVRPPPKEKE